jgi:hypothetical protein
MGLPPRRTDLPLLYTFPNLPLHLHLAGGGSLEIPPTLTHVVVLHTDLEYNQFYTLIAQMDICIPAFVGTDDRSVGQVRQ